MAGLELLDDYSGSRRILLWNARDLDHRNFLHWIANRGLVPFITETLRWLQMYGIDQQFNPDPVDEDDWTPLHMAVASNHDQAVVALLNANSQVRHCLVSFVLSMIFIVLSVE